MKLNFFLLELSFSSVFAMGVRWPSRHMASRSRRAVSVEPVEPVELLVLVASPAAYELSVAEKTAGHLFLQEERVRFYCSKI